MHSENYSLNNLEEWIEDALESEALPEEIYDTIVNTIQRKIIYHKKVAKDCQEVLDLLSFRTRIKYRDNVVKFEDVTHSKKDWDDFWKSEDFKLDSPNLHPDKD
tara:strand:+ start:105 stop:416 length:312 start_codon:yes stop_codon:yes gene_type:complete